MRRQSWRTHRSCGGVRKRAGGALGPYAACRTKMLDWFPVTAELSSATRERLRGVLVDARLGVTGKGYGAHGLSGRRPNASSFSPSRSRRGSTDP